MGRLGGGAIRGGFFERVFCCFCLFFPKCILAVDEDLGKICHCFSMKKEYTAKALKKVSISKRKLMKLCEHHQTTPKTKDTSKPWPHNNPKTSHIEPLTQQTTAKPCKTRMIALQQPLYLGRTLILQQLLSLLPASSRNC